MALLVLVMWVLLTPRFEISSASGEQLAAAFALVALSGTFLQFTTHPRMGLSDQSVLGVWPSRLAFYTAHLSKVTRRNLIATSLLPFLVLAILPLVVAATLRISPGWLVFESCLAAMMFGDNVVLLTLPAWRLPAGCVIASRGFQAYWRLPQ